MVAIQGDEILVMNPPRTPISREDALLLASWLVAIADPMEEEFNAVLNAVKGT